MKGLLASLFVKLGLDSKEFNRGIDGAKNKTNNFGGFVKKIGGMIAGAFAVSSIVSFTKELVKLGGEAEGVRAAFERIGGMQFLDNMKKATAGTVSELNLMKRSVQAQNLGLPIKNLASLFEFATKRAQETGQSVDYLVDSIVLGIGRKSPLILDNLGISAVQLREKLKGVGTETATTADIAAAVGEIAADSMRESGKVIDTNAIKIQNLKANWDNFKLGLAEAPEFNKEIGVWLDGLNRQIKLLPQGLETAWKSLKFVFGNRLKEMQPTEFVDYLDDSKTKTDALKKAWGDYLKAFNKPVVQEHIKTIGELKEETAELEKSLDLYTIKQGAEIQATLRQIEANKKLIESLTTLGRAKTENRLVPAMAGGRGTENMGSMFAQPTPGLEMGRLNDFMEANTEKAKMLHEKYFAQWEDFKNNMAAMAVDFASDVVENFGMAFGELLATGDFPEDFGKNILSTIGGFISQLGKMLIGLGIASEAFQALLKSAFTNPVSAGLAIAAGAALVVMGGAIKGFAQSGPKGAGSSGSSGTRVTSQPYTNVNIGNRDKSAMTLELNAVLKGDSIFLSNKRNTYKRSIVG